MNNNTSLVRPKGAIAWMAGNSVASNLLMIVLLVGGLIIGVQVKQEVFPEFSIDVVNVTVSYPGASPEEVERGIVLAVEEAIQGLDGVDEIKSTASEGLARISVEAVEGADVRQLAMDIEADVDAITSFPDEAERPMVAVASRRRDVASFALYGDQDERVLREKAEELRDMLLQDPNITQVELEGVRDFEIHVEIPQENLRRYGLTMADVATRISQASVELPGGSLKTKGGEILVRMRERRDLAREYARMPIITHQDGSQVLLEDLAEIREGFSDSDRYATFNGHRAVMVEVYRVGYQTPIQVADAAKAKVDEFKAGLPRGINVDLVRDHSDVFKQRADLLLNNGYLGLSLVFILLALFLEIRLAFWVSMGIPISFLGAFLLLPLADFSINMISMFAFIVTLGIVVDDAIVVGENIHYHRQTGMPYLDAAIHGAREIAMPVCFSVTTNIVAFMPLYFIPGVMGKIFGVIPVVVVTVFAVSLIESLLILPAHLGHQKDRPPRGLIGWVTRRQQAFSRAFTRFVEDYYGPLLRRVLNQRYLALALGILCLAVTGGYVKSGRMGLEMFPKVESDYAYVTATLPYGVAPAKTAAVQKRLVDAARKVVNEKGGDRLSTGIFAQVDDNVVKIRVFLTSPDIRPISTAELTEAWRRKVGEIPGLESLAFESDRGGPGSGKSLTVELSHRSVATLDAASKKLAQDLAYYPRLKDIDDGSAQGKEQFDFKMRPEGERMGLQAKEVALQVRHAFYGTTALKLLRGRNEVTVRVRLPEAERASEYGLENLMVRAKSGNEALLRNVVTMERGRAYTTIGRRAGRRIVSVTADVVPRSMTNTVASSLKKDVLPQLVKDYPGLTWSFEGRQAETQESLDSLMGGLLMALLGIYAMLAIPFRSFTQPFIIMTCIPFGFVGVVLGHLIMGYPLSVMSLFGLVALAGVVVNDSLVMVDFANRRRAAGMDRMDAIRQSGIQRFRPIMLTTLTTFGGLAPMIFETSRQARFMVPMAISLGFGILFATFITLLLVPILYMVLEDALDIFRRQPEPKVDYQPMTQEG